MRTPLLALAATVLVQAARAAPAPLPKPDPSKEDLKRMQGTWELTEQKDGGRAHGRPAETIRITVKGSRLVVFENGRQSGAYDLTVNPKARP
jgi:hypothetical protein